VDHPIRLDNAELAVRPWRTATLVMAAVAAVELVLLVMLGGVLLAKPEPAGHRKAAPARTVAAKSTTKAAPTPAKVAAAELPRRKVKVLVLNGNGRQGAAAAAASRVTRKGYRIGLVANAPSQDYVTSLVMYRRGFEGEGVRLARDLGVKIVGPLDGMRVRDLHGAHAVFVVGA
jgi:hypothetical protein